MSTPEERLSGIDRVLDEEDLDPEVRERLSRKLGGQAAALARRYAKESRKDELGMLVDLLEGEDGLSDEAWTQLARRAVEIEGDPVQAIEFLQRFQLKTRVEAFRAMHKHLMVIDGVLNTQPMRASHVLRDATRFVVDNLKEANQEIEKLNSKEYGRGGEHE